MFPGVFLSRHYLNQAKKEKKENKEEKQPIDFTKIPHNKAELDIFIETVERLISSYDTKVITLDTFLKTFEGKFLTTTLDESFRAWIYNRLLNTKNFSVMFEQLSSKDYFKEYKKFLGKPAASLSEEQKHQTEYLDYVKKCECIYDRVIKDAPDCILLGTRDDLLDARYTCYEFLESITQRLFNAKDEYSDVKVTASDLHQLNNFIERIEKIEIVKEGYLPPLHPIHTRSPTGP